MIVTLLRSIIHHKYGAQQPPRPTFFIAPMPSLSSTSALSSHSASHKDCCALCRVLSCAPTAPAIRLYLLIFPGQITDCIVVFLYLLRQTYPVYQILHFLVRFVKVCICYNFSTQPYHNFLFHIRHILPIPFPIGSFHSYASGVSLPFLPVLMPLTVPLSTAPVLCRNDAPNAQNQLLFPAIGLWCRSVP